MSGKHSVQAPDAVVIQVIERSARIVALAMPTIELAGGSVRCMLAGIMWLDAVRGRGLIEQI